MQEMCFVMLSCSVVYLLDTQLPMQLSRFKKRTSFNFKIQFSTSVSIWEGSQTVRCRICVLLRSSGCDIAPRRNKKENCFQSLLLGVEGTVGSRSRYEFSFHM
ncbi:CLUMA_CG020630, isoform A [Clunio marinus]|uniref:CLUMA_CG020630, isoform A n=1 Tax=Clunio marinus TaxID=568069 RepID=A0A1J1J5K3_9DIPT|nr:CLUMA_CG020630, isoform A [Clunio marinus]